MVLKTAQEILDRQLMHECDVLSSIPLAAPPSAAELAQARDVEHAAFLEQYESAAGRRYRAKQRAEQGAQS